MMYEIRHYLTSSGRDLYTEWLKRQRDNTARVAIVRRVLRMMPVILATKICHDGVWECASMWVLATYLLCIARAR